MYNKKSKDYTEIKNYLDNKKTLNIYNVDLSNSINKAKLKDLGNKEAQNYSELKIKGNTLIKIEEGKNVLYLEGKEEILNNVN